MRLSTNQAVGFFWEKVTLEKLHGLGYGQARLVSNFFAGVDIMLGSLPIEVKAANARPHWAGGCIRQRWQFDVTRLPKWSDSIVILVAIAEIPYFFIVPSWAIGHGRHNLHITSHPLAYKGALSPHLENWQAIEAGLAIKQIYAGQLPIFTGGIT
jgi:hypothetical protein